MMAMKPDNLGWPLAVICLFALLTQPVWAGDKGAQVQPKVLSDLLACRQTADSQARLACYDAQATTLAEATERNDIVVAERKEVERAQRDLFGFAVPSTQILGAGLGQEQVKRLETKVVSARRNRIGDWIIVMAEGGVWEQIDSKPLALSPKPGQKVFVTKGVLGSFFVSIDGQPAIKMRRVQ